MTGKGAQSRNTLGGAMKLKTKIHLELSTPCVKFSDFHK
jgi:hypothetical protein